MSNARTRVSDEAVKKATGKTWDEWIAILDTEGAQEMTHTDIARMLSDKGYIANGWWCQSVTVGYEYARGKRTIGETATAGYEIGVQKTLPISLEKAWDILISKEGLALWLGKLPSFSTEKGETYITEEGTKGEIRSLTEGKHLRLTWQPKDRKKPTTLQIYILPSGEKTSIRFHQEKLADGKEREEMREHWQKVLTDFESLATTHHHHS